MRNKKGQFVKGHKHTNEVKEKISLIHVGKKLTEEHKEKISLGCLKRKERDGYINSPEARKKGSLSKIGAKNPMYIDGRTPTLKRIHQSFRYKIWRKEVFERDNYTCKKCGHRNCKDEHKELYPHHMNPFRFSKIINYLKNKFGEDNLYNIAMDCELLWNPSIGITLCEDCHKECHV